eukprot:5850796-Pyramimonas_sp.AAC.2
MILDPSTHLEHPELLSRQIELSRIRAAQKRNGEEDDNKHSSLFKYRVGRRIAERTGWKSGEKLGRSGGQLDGAEQQAYEVQ